MVLNGSKNANPQKRFHKLKEPIKDSKILLIEPRFSMSVEPFVKVCIENLRGRNSRNLVN